RPVGAVEGPGEGPIVTTEQEQETSRRVERHAERGAERHRGAWVGYDAGRLDPGPSAVGVLPEVIQGLSECVDASEQEDSLVHAVVQHPVSAPWPGGWCRLDP